MFWTIETIASFQRVVNGNQEKKDLISPRADVPFSWRLSEDIKLQGSKMVMVGPPSWLESCANAVGSWLENPVRSRWCCARPLLLWDRESHMHQDWGWFRLPVLLPWFWCWKCSRDDSRIEGRWRASSRQGLRHRRLRAGGGWRFHSLCGW